MTPEQAQALIARLTQPAAPTFAGAVQSPMQQFAQQASYVSREDINQLVAAIVSARTESQGHVAQLAGVVGTLQDRLARVESALSNVNRALVEIITASAEPLKEDADGAALA